MMIYKNAELYNAVETEPAADGKGLWLYRHPKQLLDKLRGGGNECAVSFGRACSGVEVRFNLAEKSKCSVTLCMEGGDDVLAEVYQGSFFYKHVMIGNEPVTIPIEYTGGFGTFDEFKRRAQASGVTYDSHLIRVMLPNWPVSRLVNIEGDITPPRSEQVPDRRILFYGSSITHGLLCQRPHGSYAALLADMLGMDALNLGIPGGCFIEPEMTDYIAGRSDWDILLCELGINVMEAMDEAEFRKRVDYLLGTLVHLHPDKHVFCNDIFPSLFDPDNHGKLVVFRRHVKESAEKLNHPNLHYVPATEIMKTFGGLSVDMLHPGPDGMIEIARNWYGQIRPIINSTPGS